MVTVGKLEKVDLRTVWENEATDFTPWLLQNADYLSEVLGIDLELSASEHGVGPYSVDLIGRDASSDCVVIIENQIEKTDHKHLGQLITYAANTDATVIVWIAKKFTDEHRQAIDFLNSLSSESNKGRFYGIEVSAVRIGDSQPAAQFDVVARPNDAHTSQAEAVRDLIEPTGRRLMYRNFWKMYLEKVEQTSPGLTSRSAPWNSSWFDVTKRLNGLAHISLVFSHKSRVNVQLYISGGDAEENREVFRYMQIRQEEIEKEIGIELSWESFDGKLYCRIAAYKPGDWDVSMTDQYDEIATWMLEMNKRFKTVFTPLLNEYSKLVNSD